ncbi:MAG: hypothetical protein NVSMB25_14340 [Thermoleophilaceae bacterium]
MLMVVGGPVVFLLGETFFRVRMIGSANTKRVTAIAALGLVSLLAESVSALVQTVIVATLLTALAAWEHQPRRRGGGAAA